jgi:hypothetical protein
MFDGWSALRERANPVIRVQCPSCGHAFEFADYLAGLTAICKNCMQRIPVPASSKSLESGKDAIQPVQFFSTQAKSPETPAFAPDAIRPTPAVTLPEQMPPLTDRLPEARSIQKTSTAPPPEWALERVKAMLALAVPIPVIVERLVAKGLSAEDASTAVDLLLEDRVRRTMAPIRRNERFEAAHRWLSLGVAAATLLFAFWYFHVWYVCWTAFRLAIPLGCIWFPEVLGFLITFIPMVPRDAVQVFFIRLAAWLVLLAIAIRTITFGLAVSDV